MTHSRPSFLAQIISVWYRHYMVYKKNWLSNSFPSLLEPLIFLGAIGIGVGNYLVSIEGKPYLEFLASGLLVTSSMFSAAFECTYSTFIRLEFDKVYDGILSAPIDYKNMLIGEILWAGTKGAFFTLSILFVLFVFGIITTPSSLFALVIGFFNAILFACLSLLITSFTKSIHYFNFYFTGFISPLFFFSGIFVPLSQYPEIIRLIAQFLPLTHTVHLVRVACLIEPLDGRIFIPIAYVLLFTFVTGFLAIHHLKKRLID